MSEVLKCGGKRGRPKVIEDDCLRVKIAGEATRLFGECGYEGMKMDDLAARCQMSKKTLYRLFPSKRDIFASIAAGHRKAMLNLPYDDDRVDLEVALRHIFRLDIEEVEHVERMCMIRMFKDECPNSAEMMEILKEQGHDVALRYFSEWITRQIDLGRMRALSPDHAAKIMLDMFFGALFTPDKKIREWASTEDRRAYMEECMRIFLNGTRAFGYPTLKPMKTIWICQCGKQTECSTADTRLGTVWHCEDCGKTFACVYAKGGPKRWIEVSEEQVEFHSLLGRGS